MGKLAIGLIVAMLIGAGCRYFDVPVPSPPKLAGALLVVAMTVGYAVADRFLTKEATTASLCGGPTGKTAALSKK